MPPWLDSIIGGLGVVAVLGAGRLAWATFVGRLSRSLAQLDRRVEEVHREVQPNGGGSQRLGDRVVRVERRLDQLQDTVQRIDQRLRDWAPGDDDRRSN